MEVLYYLKSTVIVFFLCVLTVAVAFIRNNLMRELIPFSGHHG